MDITTEEVEFMRKRIVELELQNTRLKAPVSDEELYSFLHNEGQNIIVARRNQARNRINALLTSRATRTPPQEGQNV